MAHTFTVDQSSLTPPFRQIHDEVVRGVSSGQLRPGERLPPTRALAAELGVAVNTVASAYRALEEAGVVEGRGRAGTFVSLGQDPIAAAANQVALDAARRLRELGLDQASAREMFEAAIIAVYEGQYPG